MLSIPTTLAGGYLSYYHDLIISGWNNITPIQYAYLLCGIATAGYILMKSGQR